MTTHDAASISDRAAANRTGLLLAAAAFAAGGLGNVVFSLHDGTQVGLALVRFVVGLAATGVWLLVRMRSHAPARLPGTRRWSLLHATGALDAGAVVLLMLAAQSAGTLTFTLIGMLAPAVVAIFARILGLARATRTSAALAVCAVIATAASVVLAAGVPDQVTGAGVALAAGSTLCAAGSLITSTLSRLAWDPVQLLASVCGWGVFGTLVLVALGHELMIPASTVAAGVFVALVPGGIAKLALFVAVQRSAPALVSSILVVAAVTAGIGGWALLGETPGVAQVAAGAVSLACVAGIALTRPRPDAVT